MGGDTGLGMNRYRTWYTLQQGHFWSLAVKSHLTLHSKEVGTSLFSTLSVLQRPLRLELRIAMAGRPEIKEGTDFLLKPRKLNRIDKVLVNSRAAVPFLSGVFSFPSPPKPSL